jgi:hypothetical protein
MKPANGPRVCYFNAAAPLCVGDTILVGLHNIHLARRARPQRQKIEQNIPSNELLAMEITEVV